MSHLGAKVAALADGELSHDARDRALAHVAGCGTCRAELDAERRLRRVLGTTPDPALPPGLMRSLLAIGDTSSSGAPSGAAPIRDTSPDLAEPVGRRQLGRSRHARLLRRSEPVRLGAGHPYDSRPPARTVTARGRAEGARAQQVRRMALLGGSLLGMSSMALAGAFVAAVPAGVQPPVSTVTVGSQHTSSAAGQSPGVDTNAGARSSVVPHLTDPTARRDPRSPAWGSTGTGPAVSLASVSALVPGPVRRNGSSGRSGTRTMWATVEVAPVPMVPPIVVPLEVAQPAGRR